VEGQTRTTVTVASQFRGPPQSGNGGYVCGLLAEALGGPVTAMLRAPVPLDQALTLVADGETARLVGPGETLIGEARRAAPEDLPAPPAPPSLAQARAAAERFVGLQRTFHPICFTCGPSLADGVGLRVFAGQIEGAPAGHVAGPWTPHAAFAGADGLIPAPIIWAALDCPGSVAWVVQEGGGGLLGTMTAQVLRHPTPGETLTVLAWPMTLSGRKRFAGTALYSAEGELLAHSAQIWIGRAPVSPE
jgi:hypothetical protein